MSRLKESDGMHHQGVIKVRNDLQCGGISGELRIAGHWSIGEGGCVKKIVFTTAGCYHHHKKYSFHYIDGGFFPGLA